MAEAQPAAGATAGAVSTGDRRLRVALIWNGSVQSEQTLATPAPIIVGPSLAAGFIVPDSALAADVVLLEPSGAGYRLNLAPGVGGAIWVGGERRDVAELGSGPVPLGPDDYGVLTFGTLAFFFQHVRAPARPRGAVNWDATIIASQGLSGFTHAALIALMFLALAEMDRPDPLELPTDLIRRFMVTPPPESIVEPPSSGGTDTADPGINDREEAGGTPDEGEEGRVGEESSDVERTEIEGEVTGGAAARVATVGLLGVLNSAEGNPLAAALTGPSIGDLLGGLGSDRTIMGRGSGGTGLRGTGGGGGGTGPGTLFGAGGVGTGVGAGSGHGGGRGSGGPGAAGRARGEVSVRVTTEAPRVSGYLSPEQILRVVRANMAAVRYCYENELSRQPSLRGRIEISWRVNREGRVATARVARSTMGNARVEGCIVRQVRNWRFPVPDGGEVDVVFPFIFGAASD